MRVSIIKANEPDANGCIWPEEVLKRAVERMNEKQFFIQPGYSSDGLVHLANVAGFTVPGTALLKDGQMFSTVKWLTNEKGSYGRNLVELADCVMGGCWTGIIKGNKIGNNAELIYIAIITTPQGEAKCDRLSGGSKR